MVAVLFVFFIYNNVKLEYLFSKFFSGKVKLSDEIAKIEGVPDTYMGQHGGGVIVLSYHTGKIYKLSGNRQEMGEWFKTVEDRGDQSKGDFLVTVSGALIGKEKDIITTSRPHKMPGTPDVWGQNIEPWKEIPTEMEILKVSSIIWQ